MAQPAPKTSTTYISNPFQLLGPSATALGINISTLLMLLALQLAPIIPLLIAIGIGVAGRSNPILIGIAFTLGIAAVAVMIVIGLLSIPTFALIALASADGQRVELKETLLKARPFIGRSLGIAILSVLAAIGGLILFIVPGIIFIAWFTLAEYVLVQENLGVVASMKRSRQLVKGRVWEILGVMAIPSVASLVPFVGGILNFVLGVVLVPANAIRYRQLMAVPADQRPGVHWSNKVLSLVPLVIVTVVLIGAIAFGLMIHDYENPNYQGKTPSAMIATELNGRL